MAGIACLRTAPGLSDASTAPEADSEYADLSLEIIPSVPTIPAGSRAFQLTVNALRDDTTDAGGVGATASAPTIAPEFSDSYVLSMMEQYGGSSARACDVSFAIANGPALPAPTAAAHGAVRISIGTGTERQTFVSDPSTATSGPPLPDGGERTEPLDAGDKFATGTTDGGSQVQAGAYPVILLDTNSSPEGATVDVLLDGDVTAGIPSSSFSFVMRAVPEIKEPVADSVHLWKDALKLRWTAAPNDYSVVGLMCGDNVKTRTAATANDFRFRRMCLVKGITTARLPLIAGLPESSCVLYIANFAMENVVVAGIPFARVIQGFARAIQIWMR